MMTFALIWMARNTAAVSVEKYGIARAAGKDHDAPLLEVAEGAAADVRLGQLLHADRRHDARVDALALEHVLQRQRVDDGAEHAHVVGGDAVHAGLGELRAAHDVAAADHQADATRPCSTTATTSSARRLDRVEVEAESLVSGEGFAGELEQDARVFQVGMLVCSCLVGVA